MDSEETFICDDEIIDGLYVDRSLSFFEKITYQMPTEKMPNKRYVSEILTENELILMNLWYVFKTVNMGSPFVLPYPFT